MSRRRPISKEDYEKEIINGFQKKSYKKLMSNKTLKDITILEKKKIYNFDEYKKAFGPVNNNSFTLKKGDYFVHFPLYKSKKGFKLFFRFENGNWKLKAAK